MWNTFILSPMVNVLIWIYDLILNNFGLAIIIFTILIRLLTYPLTAQQLKGQQKMQELQGSKKWQEIQKKYKDDKEKLAQEQMAIYKEMGINPLGSCLPLVIQFPIMIGLYQSISLAMASAPIQLLNLSRDLYAFIPASVLIPLNSQFLWMNLGLPETSSTPFILPIGDGYSYTNLDHHRGHYHLAPIQADDPGSKSRRPGCPNVKNDEPVYAHLDGMDFIHLGFRFGIVFYYEQCPWYCSVCDHGQGNLEQPASKEKSCSCKVNSSAR